MRIPALLEHDPFAFASSRAPAAPMLAAPTVGQQMVSAIGGFSGEKFPGGYGYTYSEDLDYWTLRARSSELFERNIYGRGIIRRLVTNEINTGLQLEADPNFDFLPGAFTEDKAQDWTDDTENRFELWAKSPALSDQEGLRTFYQAQKDARRESLIEGDVLVISRIDKVTKLPRVELIRGGRVSTPLNKMRDPKVMHGVQVDDRNRQVGYWVLGADGKHTYVPARGPKSGRRMAWLLYGTERRVHQHRGAPLLSIVLQSIKELDRYRDAELRASVVNAMIAFFIENQSGGPGTRPISGGARVNERVTGTGVDGQPREWNASGMTPGVSFEELAKGEKPSSFDTKRPNVNYGAFEESIVHAIAWANEIPPEVLKLEYSNNYSASKAAISEFKAYLVAVRADFGASFCQPFYAEWLTGEVMADRVKAEGFLESRRSRTDYAVLGSWTRAEWGGPVKPSVELKKDVDAYLNAIGGNLITYDRASKDLFGVRNSKVLRKLKKERSAIEEMNEELGLNDDPVPTENDLNGTQQATVLRLVEDMIEETAQNA